MGSFFFPDAMLPHPLSQSPYLYRARKTVFIRSGSSSKPSALSLICGIYPRRQINLLFFSDSKILTFPHVSARGKSADDFPAK